MCPGDSTFFSKPHVCVRDFLRRFFPCFSVPSDRSPYVGSRRPPLWSFQYWVAHFEFFKTIGPFATLLFDVELNSRSGNPQRVRTGFRPVCAFIAYLETLFLLNPSGGVSLYSYRLAIFAKDLFTLSETSGHPPLSRQFPRSPFLRRGVLWICPTPILNLQRSSKLVDDGVPCYPFPPCAPRRILKFFSPSLFSPLNSSPIDSFLPARRQFFQQLIWLAAPSFCKSHRLFKSSG